MSEKQNKTVDTAVKPKRVMFVDDNLESVLKEMQRLQEAGYEIDLYTDPKEALEKFRREPYSYQAIVADFMLPGMWGDEFAKQVREIDPAQKLVLWTGESGALNLENRLLLGDVDLRRKPNNVLHLLDGADNAPAHPTDTTVESSPLQSPLSPRREGDIEA